MLSVMNRLDFADFSMRIKGNARDARGSPFCIEAR